MPQLPLHRLGFHAPLFWALAVAVAVAVAVFFPASVDEELVESFDDQHTVGVVQVFDWEEGDHVCHCTIACQGLHALLMTSTP